MPDRYGPRVGPIYEFSGYRRQRTERRLLSKIHASEAGCWRWQGSYSTSGYGQTSLVQSLGKYRMVSAHRAVYLVFVGPIAPGLQVDHLCENKWCVNPHHLEVVSARENTMRAASAPATVNARKTHCPRNHPLEGDNLYSKNGRRHCRTCRQANNAARYLRVVA